MLSTERSLVLLRRDEASVAARRIIAQVHILHMQLVDVFALRREETPYLVMSTFTEGKHERIIGSEAQLSACVRISAGNKTIGGTVAQNNLAI